VPTAQLQLEQVSLFTSIGAQYLLKDISLEVFKGDRIAIVGPSGAGKTSLLRLLNRLSEPTAGSIYLENQAYCQIPVIQLRQQVTLVLQESKLLGMTVQEALKYPLVLRGLPRSQIQQRLAYWMEQLHIPVDWLGKTELQLSVGQRQLVAIARALVIQPQVLLLDEPTSALDAGRALHLIQVLSQLANSGETTILMVNHQLDLAQLFSTRVFYLQNGQLILDAPNSHQMNWEKLHETLIQAEATAAEEWMGLT
jgi:D-methionine transport system ATP-binding protein